MQRTNKTLRAEKPWRDATVRTCALAHLITFPADVSLLEFIAVSPLLDFKARFLESGLLIHEKHDKTYDIIQLAILHEASCNDPSKSKESKLVAALAEKMFQTPNTRNKIETINASLDFAVKMEQFRMAAELKRQKLAFQNKPVESAVTAKSVPLPDLTLS